MTGRLGIDDVTPTVGDGHHPSKAVVGEVIPVTASVWREGHDAIAANGFELAVVMLLGRAVAGE